MLRSFLPQLPLRSIVQSSSSSTRSLIPCRIAASPSQLAAVRYKSSSCTTCCSPHSPSTSKAHSLSTADHRHLSTSASASSAPNPRYNNMGSDGKSEPPTTGWTGPVPSSKGGTDEPQYILKPPYMWYSDEFKVKYTASCWCEKIHFEFAVSSAVW